MARGPPRRRGREALDGQLEGFGARATGRGCPFKPCLSLKSDRVEVWVLARVTPCVPEALLEGLEPRIRLQRLKSPASAPDALAEAVRRRGLILDMEAP